VCRASDGVASAGVGGFSYPSPRGRGEHHTEKTSTEQLSMNDRALSLLPGLVLHRALIILTPTSQ
jgi:hypothetical protein